jgi:hypothetical protein
MSESLGAGHAAIADLARFPRCAEGMEQRRRRFVCVQGLILVCFIVCQNGFWFRALYQQVVWYVCMSLTGNNHSHCHPPDPVLRFDPSKEFECLRGRLEVWSGCASSKPRSRRIPVSCFLTIPSYLDLCLSTTSVLLLLNRHVHAITEKNIGESLCPRDPKFRIPLFSTQL